MDQSNFTAAPQPGGPGPATPPSLRPVGFVSHGGDFQSLLIRGGLLELVTFGFYRFWLATAMRRYLWSHTLVDGENAEYTGTGRELLIGFLFALAILVPIFLVYFLIGLEAERLQAFASVPLGLFMVLFGSFALYRARRYRLTRTIWRGVRFWMQGSGWKFAMIAFGWMILTALTLGAAYPWRAAALERYKLQNTFYGDLQGGFDARAIDFFKQGSGMWLFTLVTLLMLAGGGVLSASGSSGSGGTLVGFGIFMMLALPFIYPFFKALEWRWWASGVSFGGTRLKCDLRGGSLLGLYVKTYFFVWLATLAAGLAVGALGLVLFALFGLSVGQFNMRDLNDLLTANTWVTIAATLVGYLFIVFVAGVVYRYMMQHEYWRRISSTMTLIKPESMEGVAAKGDLAHALGEGLADGLDVAGF